MTIHDAVELVRKTGISVPHYRRESREWVIGIESGHQLIHVEPLRLLTAIANLRAAGLHVVTVRQEHALDEQGQKIPETHTVEIVLEGDPY